MVIIAILASIVLGYVQDAVTRTREAALIENLGRMRAMIERWAFHHGGVYPRGGELQDGGDEGEEGEGTAETTTGQQIASLAGVELPICTVADNRGKRTIHVVEDVGHIKADPSPQTGWKYSTTTGQFICNSAQIGTNDIPYDLW